MPRFILICLLLFSLSSSVYADKRVALVIGNASYAKDVLRNPLNDANDIANILRTKLGFTVILLKNSNRRAMHKAVQQFKAKLSRNTEVAFFFYSGHGAQFRGG